MRCWDAKVPFPWACTKWGQNEDKSLQRLLFYHHLCQTIHHQYCNHIGHLEAPNLVSLSAFKAFRSRLSKSKVLNNQDGHTQTSKQTSAPNAIALILACCSAPSCTRLLLKYASALAKRSPARGGCVGNWVSINEQRFWSKRCCILIDFCTLHVLVEFDVPSIRRIGCVGNITAGIKTYLKLILEHINM